MRLLAGLTLALLLVLPAKAEPVADSIISQAVLPGYLRLAEAAEVQVTALDQLCARPSQNGLSEARAAFADTVRAWSQVELYRFGPAREDYRYEKLFYWPDRKGRGLRQVQRLLGEEDPSASTAERLAGKSVALQGLPALEYLLFGTGSEVLAERAGYRCAYALAAAEVIAGNAEALQAAWANPAGFPALLRQPGIEGSPYQSEGEVLQEFLRSAAAQLQLVAAIKLARTLGSAPEKAKPKRAPFWRSGLTLASLQGNLQGVGALMRSGIDQTLPASQAHLARSLAFELATAETQLAALENSALAWVDLATSAEGYRLLGLVVLPVMGAQGLVGERYPQALGLTLGFNALDGD
ncbi:MAG: imelysin family protein [Pseudomonadota bacterium]